MKKYILGLSLVLLFIACSKAQEEININNQAIEPICYTGETEIFPKNFIHENTGISFEYPSYWEFYFDHENRSQVLTDSCADIIIYRFNKDVFADNLDEYINLNYNLSNPQISKTALVLNNLKGYKALGYKIENLNESDYYSNDILVAQNTIGLFKIKIQINKDIKNDYKEIIEEIIQSLTMPTETFAFIKEEPEARQIMKNFIFDNIKDLCERYVEQDIQVKKDLTINIPFNCNSFENQNNLTLIKKNDSKKNRSIYDRSDSSNEYQIHMIYILTNDGNDSEFDISGKGEQFLNELKKELYEKLNKNIHFDYDKNNKHDISFARIPLNHSEIFSKPNENELNSTEIISTYLSKIGFNNPNKLYLAILDKPMMCGSEPCKTNKPNLKKGHNIIISSRYDIKNNQEYLMSNKDQIQIIIDAVDLSKNKNFKFPTGKEIKEHCIMIGKLEGKKIFNQFFQDPKLQETINKIKSSEFEYKQETENYYSESNKLISFQKLYFGNLIIYDNETWCLKTK